MIHKIFIAFLFLINSSCIFSQKEYGIWEIKNGVLQNEITANNNELGQSYWNVITNMLPKHLINTYIVSLRLFTDGEEEDLGGLNQLDNSVVRWLFDLDIEDANINSKDESEIIDYSHTIIHEFGHLLTLNSTQIELTDDLFQDENKGYLTSEGYAKKESYLGLFVREFWSIDRLIEWDKIDSKKNSNRKAKKLLDFYFQYENEFVTDYAAEAPEEDIAESWTYFVLCDAPSKGVIKNDKILFFYNFPELVEYRNYIRQHLKIVPKNYLTSTKSNYSE
ncbi:putative zinc-binding metallopeptidase [Flavicella sp.]|uniref:putative zinc-binding metallopeptidase n=1 Tax=Flavicella sp. TaxID=2957742 RepID=UPI00260FED59|nr:putative zinc-binding metallopeptidase [Flavicella sp.]MDG1805806.1 putative zinc-binding metallopeptidase [Flavicella sp.]